MAFVSITPDLERWTPPILGWELARAGGGEAPDRRPPGVLWIGDGAGPLIRMARASAGLILVGAWTPGGQQSGESTRQLVRALLEAGVRVVPETVLTSREGLPTVRRYLEKATWQALHLVVEARPADASGARAEALIGVARAAGNLAGRGRFQITGLDVRGWPVPGSCEAGRARREFLCNLFAATLRPKVH